jgi:hypothetical protein
MVFDQNTLVWSIIYDFNGKPLFEFAIENDGIIIIFQNIYPNWSQLQIPLFFQQKAILLWVLYSGYTKIGFHDDYFLNFRNFYH